MKAIQWSMTIPTEKQEDFVKYSQNVLKPTWQRFGCKRYECHKVVGEKIIPKQIAENDKFIERLYFEDDFDVVGFFSAVKKDENANKISRSYEELFGARDIELRVLLSVSE